jgi:hypothetical protein
MSNYDLTAIASDPELYISSASASDQSGKGLFIVTNGSQNIGQPIIAGNASSLRIDSTHTIDLDANPLFFRNNSYLELVGYFTKPSDSICIFGDLDGYNGIFIDPAGVELRFVDSNLTLIQTRINLLDWPLKAHITVNFDSQYATLYVNDVRSQVEYVATDPTTITAVSFKSIAGYSYLVDGIGVYSNKFINKSDMINAKDFDYFNFTSGKYTSIGTVFNGYRQADERVIPSSDFMLHPDGYYVSGYIFIPQSEELFEAVLFECSDPTVQVTYKIDNEAEETFDDLWMVFPSVNLFSVTFKVLPEEMSKVFSLTIKAYFDLDITTASPAKLIANGAIYSGSTDIKIVDCPEGVYFRGGYYTGEWYVDPPKSVEIVFMGHTDAHSTFVFSSSDGEASFGPSGAVTGYTAYLNGALVTDLDDVVLNQWNHLILTKSSVSDTTFFMNQDQLEMKSSDISYLYLNAYPVELSAPEAAQLYRIISSSHKLSVIDSPSPITEGEAEYDSPFLLYSFAWSIIGGNVG